MRRCSNSHFWQASMTPSVGTRSLCRLHEPGSRRQQRTLHTSSDLLCICGRMEKSLCCPRLLAAALQVCGQNMMYPCIVQEENVCDVQQCTCPLTPNPVHAKRQLTIHRLHCPACGICVHMHAQHAVRCLRPHAAAVAYWLHPRVLAHWYISLFHAANLVYRLHH